MKKIIGIFLTLTLVLAILPASRIAVQASSFIHDSHTKIQFEIYNLTHTNMYNETTSDPFKYPDIKSYKLEKTANGQFTLEYTVSLPYKSIYLEDNTATITDTVTIENIDCAKYFELILTREIENPDEEGSYWNYELNIERGAEHCYSAPKDNYDGTHTKVCYISDDHVETTEHDYSTPATCITKKTCGCGATAGLPLGHDVAPAEYNKPSACIRCGVTDLNEAVSQVLSGREVRLPTEKISNMLGVTYPITWSVVNAGNTGATIQDNTLRSVGPGTAIIRATTTDVTKDYLVFFSPVQNIDVGDGRYTLSKESNTVIKVEFQGGYKTVPSTVPFEITGTHSSYEQNGDLRNPLITVESGTMNIVLKNVNVYKFGTVIEIKPGATVKLILVGDNSLYADNNGAAIRLSKGANLTIEGTGSLTAFSDGYNAGIGEYMTGECGNLTINSGTITASGNTGIGGTRTGSGGNITINGGIVNATGHWGAGIGGGGGSYEQSGHGGNITINGGIVNATSTWGAGIGGGGVFSESDLYIGKGGDGGNITINGGTVTASSTHQHGGAGIGGGGGYYGGGGNGGNVVINGGNIKVSSAGGMPIGKGFNGESDGTLKDANGNELALKTVTLQGSEQTSMVADIKNNETSLSYGLTDMQTLDNNKLYLYLPETEAVTEVKASGIIYSDTSEDGTLTASHTHTLNFSASYNYIHIICTAENCPFYDLGSLKLCAPSDLAYKGDRKFATINNTSVLPLNPVIVYTQNGEELEEAPKEPGTYTASVTLGDAKASIEFTIGDKQKTHFFSYDEESGKAIVHIAEPGTYTLFFADYGENGLNAVHRIPMEIRSEMVGNIPLDNVFGTTLSTGDRLMLWSEITKMVPKCEPFVIQ